MKVFVYYTPESTPQTTIADCAIAVDVLRATTTIAAALAAGAEGVQAFSDLDELLQVSDTWLPERRLRIGERGGKTVEGFDLGNSPLDCTPERVQDRRIFMSTTNGTRALQRIAPAATVLAAALTNRQAVVDAVLHRQPESVWIVGSGWEGSYSLEDTVCAGAIAHGLMTGTDQEIATLAGNDETVAAIALFQQYQSDLLTLLHTASHGQRLLKLNRHADLEYCAQLDMLAVLPIQKTQGVLVKG